MWGSNVFFGSGLRKSAFRVTKLRFSTKTIECQSKTLYAERMKTRTRQLTDHVHRQLYDRLADRKLRTGEHVKSQDVAIELGVSQATARKAIARLVREGWLESGENGRPVVVKHPPKRRRKSDDEAFQGITEQTAERIVDLALGHRFRPGEVIKARPLAQELGVSLPTARAALDTLCRDGMLNRLPRRGWQIAPIKLDEVRTMFTVRRTLEPMVLEKLFTRIDNRAIEEMLIETEQMIAGFDQATRVERMHAEHRFHQRLIEMADDQVLSEVLQPLVRKMIVVVNVTHGLSHSVFPEHKRILEAILRRDKAEAIKCLERDLADPLEVGFYDWD